MRDRRTGLVWTARSDARGLPWAEAERWCGELGGQQNAAWRLPAAEELSGLFDAAESQRCGEDTCRVDPAIALAEPFAWSATQRGEGRRVYLDFRFGTELAPRIRPGLVRGVLCVRGGSAADPATDTSSR